MRHSVMLRLPYVRYDPRHDLRQPMPLLLAGSTARLLFWYSLLIG